jgi:hypothetical protein
VAVKKPAVKEDRRDETENTGSLRTIWWPRSLPLAPIGAMDHREYFVWSEDVWWEDKSHGSSR